MSTVIQVCNKYSWAGASSVSWLQFYVVPPGYCKIIGSWNILRPITRAFPGSTPINHPPCSIKGKVPMLGARNTNFYDVSMCSLERCAGACLSVRKQFQNWGFAPTLILLMWQQTWSQKDFTGSPLGAKVAKKNLNQGKNNYLGESILRKSRKHWAPKANTETSFHTGKLHFEG